MAASSSGIAKMMKQLHIPESDPVIYLLFNLLLVSSGFENLVICMFKQKSVILMKCIDIFISSERYTFLTLKLHLNLHGKTTLPKLMSDLLIK